MNSWDDCREKQWDSADLFSCLEYVKITDWGYESWCFQAWLLQLVDV